VMRRALAMVAMLTLMHVASAQERSANGPGQQRPPTAADDAREEARKPGPATLEQAIQIAVKRFGGRAAGSETVVLESGKRVHEIRLLGDEGNVRTVRIDPETGAIL
jgi:uncharacterized membrane protein YkoI